MCELEEIRYITVIDKNGNYIDEENEMYKIMDVSNHMNKEALN